VIQPQILQTDLKIEIINRLYVMLRSADSFRAKAIDRSIKHGTKAMKAKSRPYLVVLGPDRA
jgi:hypothetical protein